MCACDQSSIFSTGGKFRPDYWFLLELHTLSLVARSYVLLVDIRVLDTKVMTAVTFLLVIFGTYC